MKKTSMFVLAVFALVSFLCAAPAAQDPPAALNGAVEITFNRPNAVGDSYDINIHMDFHSVSSQGFGSQGDRQILNVTGDLSAGIKVLKVNDAGEPTMLFCNVKTAKINKDGKDEDPGLDGVQIGVTFPESGTKFIRRDGKEVSKQAKFLLSQIFQAPNGVNPDDYLSAKRAVKPGESWDANSEVLAKLLSEEGSSVKPSEIKGKVTFLGIEKWNGMDCYHILFEAKAENITRPSYMGTASIEVNNDEFLPVDTRANASRTKVVIKSDFNGKYIAENQPMVPIKDKTTVTIESIVK